MTAEQPGLVAFILARMDDEIGLIIENTPVFAPASSIGVSQPFADHYLDRGALIGRVRADQELAAQVVKAMSAEQQHPGGHDGPVTALGSDILKSLALANSDHPDYRAEWAPTP